MSLAGAECGKRPNSSAPSDGGGGRPPRSFRSWQWYSTLMQERKSLSAATGVVEETGRERGTGEDQREKTRSVEPFRGFR